MDKTSPDKRFITGKFVLLAIVGFVLISLIVYNANVRDTFSDPYGALIASQSILNNHTIKLDAYVDRLWIDHHGIITANEHLYEYYPLGTPVLSLPAVMLAHMRGYNMLLSKDLAETQISIISFLNPLVFVVLFIIGRCYVSTAASFVIAFVSFFGSSLMSSLGTALWSHNYATLLTSLGLMLLALHDTGRTRSLNPYLLGTVLFLSYFCRPTSAIFILVVFTYLLVKDRKILLKTGATSFCLMLGFVGFSWHEYGQLLPPYYMLKLGGEESSFLTALYGLLLSPSRGLLVFSPFLLPVLAATAYMIRRLKGDALFWMALGWFAVHILVLSNWYGWWGGNSFGPRLQTDSLPALVFISFLLWRRIIEEPKRKWFRYSAAGVYLTLGVLAIWINSYQGLNNKWTQVWNENPIMKVSPVENLFNWRYPQFLATGESFRENVLNYIGRDKYEVFIDYSTYSLKSVARLRKATPHDRGTKGSQGQ
jgi:hypothetical protein